MLKIKLLLLGFYIVVTMGCSDHGHSHDKEPTKHDSIN